MQAAAVGRVDAGYARTSCPQEGADHPPISAALGAVTVQDVWSEGPNFPGNPGGCGKVGRRQLATHGKPDEAKAEKRPHARDHRIVEGIAAGRVANDANRVTGSVLSLGKVADVTKEAARRLAETMHDPHRAASPRRMVTG